MKNSPVKHDVSCEIEGKIYSAKYFIEGGMLTVTSMVYGSKSAVPGSAPEVIARMLLGELLMDAERLDRLRQ